MKYALINPTNQVDRVSHDGPGGIDPTVPTKEGYRWLPIVAAARPSYDQETQYVDGPTLTVQADQVVESYTTRNLATAELNQNKEDRLNTINLAVFGMLFNMNNRVRVLEGQTAQTKAQFRAAIKALL